MKVAEDFKYSQNNLQDFSDCRRRFWYRYIQDLSWPALEAEPAIENERFMRAGSAFHQLVHQYIVGIPREKLEASLVDPLLIKWWGNFIAHVPFDEQEQHYPELPMITKLDGQLILAKFDLVIAHSDGHYTILDWKTSRKRPERSALSARLQTKVYPFVLANGPNKLSPEAPISPEKIEMIYWFANYPDQPEVFAYSQAQYAEDQALLSDLINAVTALEGADDFPLTLDLSRCKYCRYRSLCDRGIGAGDLEDAEFMEEAADDFEIDFNETAPIKY